MKNYVVLLNTREMSVEKIFASDYAEDERLGEVFCEWQETYCPSYNQDREGYDIVMARAEDMQALRSFFLGYSDFDSAERHGPAWEENDENNGPRNYVLLIDETGTKVVQIWISDVETDANIVEVSIKIGGKFTGLPKEHTGFNTICVRANSPEEAKLQLSFMNGSPYHTGWYTAERSKI